MLAASKVDPERGQKKKIQEKKEQLHPIYHITHIIDPGLSHSASFFPPFSLLKSPVGDRSGGAIATLGEREREREG